MNGTAAAWIGEVTAAATGTLSIGGYAAAAIDAITSTTDVAQIMTGTAAPVIGSVLCTASASSGAADSISGTCGSIIGPVICSASGRAFLSSRRQVAVTQYKAPSGTSVIFQGCIFSNLRR